MRLTNISFGRHGSFQLRYGWLTKGFQACQKNSNNIFNSDNATAILGVGKNMVGSISYWLKATQIFNSDNKPSLLGERLLGEYDTYLEDDATLWILHLKLAQNKELSTSIYWLFNHFHKNSFTLDEAFNALKHFLIDSKQVSETTLKMDIGVILRMYAPHKSDKTQIEEMLESPLSLLNLIEYHNGKYHFIQSKKEQIPVEIIAYAINDYFIDSKTIPVKDLMHGDKLALGNILKISEENLIFYLEKLAHTYPKDFQLREDAGIFQLHNSYKTNKLDFLKKYYANN